MIQEATGKFSSRCVLPDRRSLAVVIGMVASVELDAAEQRKRRRGRTPYMGNPPAKPMLSRDFRDASGPVQACTARSGDDHCPWLVSTWLQAFVSFGRFCCRHARMVNSP